MVSYKLIIGIPKGIFTLCSYVTTQINLLKLELFLKYISCCLKVAAGGRVYNSSRELICMYIRTLYIGVCIYACICMLVYIYRLCIHTYTLCTYMHEQVPSQGCAVCVKALPS